MSQGTMLTRFLKLPVELQIQVWEDAFLSNTNPRLACLQVQSTPSARLSHEVLNLNDTGAEIGWRILSPMYLRETDSLTSLLGTCQLSRTITLQQMQRQLDTPWLRQLGLSKAHIDPEKDIICFGHPEDHNGTNRFMAGTSLVLGIEFPNIMVPALPFRRHLLLDLQTGRADPVSGALTALRSVDTVWDQIFRPEGDGPLTSPGLPRNIYYFFPSPYGVPRYEHRTGSFCLHFEHLNIIPWDEVPTMLYASNWHPEHGAWLNQRIGLVRDITHFWHHVRALPGFGDKTPNIFFVEINE